jgi:regulator of sigma E protease
VREIMIDEGRTVEVIRNGSRMVIELPADIDERALDRGDKELFSERFPFYVGEVIAGEDAERAGIRVNDRIMAVNGSATPYFNDFRTAVKDYEDTLVSIRVQREGQEFNIPTHVGDGVIGVRPMGIDSLIARGHPFVVEKKRYTLLQSIPAGIRSGIEKLGSYVRSLKLVFTASGAKQVGGFGAIGSMFPSKWIWVSFWELTAFLSIMLAFMNILPIPALDGGHVMFLLYEMVARKPASQKVMEWAQMAGMALLVSLLVFANGNDLYKLITGQ